MPQFGLDVLAALIAGKVVEGVLNGLHSVGDVPFAEVFLAGDDPDAQQFEGAFGDGGFNVVAERPRAHIDDDEVDIAVGFEVSHHSPEDRPALNALGRVARFDEFGDDSGAPSSGFGLADFALGSD
ncbi:MAG: hypothetical protein QOG53_1388 [Frankiales bacterium]|nr:hypothetical protein [Frankiales bacterium]